MKRRGFCSFTRCLCCCGDNRNNNHAEQSDLLRSTITSPALIPLRSSRMKSCKLHKIPIGIVVIIALFLSIFSCADCKFVRVNVGFTPDNTIYRSEEFGLGLWSMEDPNAPEKCLMLDVSRTLGSVTRGDRYYSSSFFNGDIIWGTARIIALSGIFFGLVDVVRKRRLVGNCVLFSIVDCSVVLPF